MKEMLHEKSGWCGPGVIQRIASYEGMAFSQSELAQIMKTTQEEGTSQKNLHEGAKSIGLKAFQLKGLEIEELSTLLEHHYIVVNWMDGEDEKEDGHYSLLDRVENGIVYLNDAEMPVKEFEEKWYDIEEDGNKIEKWAMIISKAVKGG